MTAEDVSDNVFSDTGKEFFHRVAHNEQRARRGSKPITSSGQRSPLEPWRLSTSLKLALNIFLKLSKESFDLAQ
jgi:hypothetical protein